MEKQHLKRLGYGFSALVMALSAVTFVPGESAYATDATGEVAVATVDAIVAGDAILNLTANVVLQGTVTLTDGEALVINLNGFTLSSTVATMFQVQAGATLTINGNGVVNQGAGVITDSTSTGTIIINGGTYAKSINEASRTLFNCAGTNITINGGDFSAIEQTFGGYGITRGGATVTINGGTFGYEPIVPAEKAVYQLAEGVYEVAKLSTFTANGDSYITTTGTKLNIGSAPIDVIVNGAKWFPTVVITDADDEEVTAATVAYSYNATSGNLKITPKVSGKYYVSVTDKSGEAQVITVTAYNALPAAQTYYKNLGETVVLNDILDDAWETTYSLADDDEANTTAVAENGTVTITADTVGTDVYTFSKTVDGVEDPITTTVTVVSYKVASEYILGASPVLDNIEDIVELPEGWDFAVTPVGADATKVDYAAHYLLPVAKGSRKFTYTLDKGTPADGTDDIDEEVTVYVNGTATEVADRSAKLGDDLDLAPLYVNKANEASVVTYTGDVTAEGESTVDTSTVGTKVVTIKETLAGETIAEQEVEIEVYGLELPAIEFFAGESYTFEPTMNGVTILGVARNSSKLSITEADGAYEFTTAIANSGDYIASYSVEYEDETTDVLAQTIKSYRKVDYTNEDLTIDLVEGSTDTDASFTLIYDADSDVVVTLPEGLTREEGEDGDTYTLTATEVGTYTVTVTQTAGALDPVTIEIPVEVVDSTVVLNPTLTLLDEEDLELTIGDEEGASFGFTYSDIEDPNFTIVITDSEDEDATEDFAYGFVEGEEAGEVLANIVAGEGADAGTYTLTLTETTSEKSVQKTIVVSEAEEPEMPAFEETTLFKVMAAGTSIEVEAETGANVKVFDLSEYIGEEDEDEQGIAVYENHYAFADEGDITVEETAEGVYTISALKAGGFYVNIEKQDEEGNIVVTNVTLIVTSATTEAADTVTDLLSDELEAVNASADAFVNYFKVMTTEYDTEEEYNEAVAAAEAALEEAFQATEDAELAIQNAFGDDAEAIMAAVVEGKTLSTKVEVEKLDEVDEDVETALLDALGADYVGNVSFYDIDVDLYADGIKIGTLKELTSEQTIVIEGLKAAEAGYTRVYKVVRYHTYIDENGDEQVAVDEIEDVEFDADAGTLTFGSDKFSTYAVSYIDELSASVDTGRNTAEASASSSAVVAIASAIAAITLGGAAIFAKRK